MGQKTTTRHKEDNTFRYETFAEKLRKINKNFKVKLRDGRFDVSEDDETTHFYQSIIGRTELDLTLSFTKLVNEIGPSVKSLAQILLDKDRLLALLLSNITSKEARPSFVSTLELVQSLARDIDSEFEEFIPRFIEAICQVVLVTKNVSDLEAGFQCVAQICVNYRVHITNSFSKYLKVLIPMWSSKNKGYVSVFIAECFQVISMKVWRKSPERFLKSVFKVVLNQVTDANHGIASLLSVMVTKAISETEAIKLLTDIVEFDVEKPEDRRVWINTTCLLVDGLKKYFDEKLNVFKAFCEVVEARLTIYLNKNNDDCFMEYLELYKFTLTASLESRAQEVDNRDQQILSMMKSCSGMPSAMDLLVEIVCSIIRNAGENPSRKLVNLTLRVVSVTPHELLDKVQATVAEQCWNLSEYLAQFVERWTNLELKQNIKEYSKVNILSTVASTGLSWKMYKSSILPPSQSFTENSIPSYYADARANPDEVRIGSKSHCFTVPASDFDRCTSKLEELVNTKDITHDWESIIRLLVTFTYVKAVGMSYSNYLQQCLRLSNSIVEKVNSNGDEFVKKMPFAVLYYAMETLPSNMLELHIMDYFKSVETHIKFSLTETVEGNMPPSLWALKGLDDLLLKLSEASSLTIYLDEIRTTSIQTNVTANLRCGYKIIRALSLSILYYLEKDSANYEAKTALELCLKIEELSICDVSFATRANENFEKLKCLAAIKNSVCLPIIVNFTLGYMFTNFKPVWTQCVTILKICLATDIKVAWESGVSQAFALAHQPNVVVFSPRELNEFEQTSVLGRITLSKFALSKLGKSDLSRGLEILDICLYRVNVWQCLEGMNEKYSAEEVLKEAAAIVKSSKQEFPFRGLTRTFETKEIRRALMPVLNFLGKSSSIITNEKNRDFWFTLLKDLLIADEDVKLAVYKVLCRVKPKELKPYSDGLDILVKNHGSASTNLSYFNLDSPECKILTEHRMIILEVVVRIILENSLDTERGRREALLRLLGSCGNTIVFAYMRLALEIWENSVELKDPNTALKVVEGRLIQIESMMTIWKYQFEQIPPELLNITCNIVQLVNAVNVEDQVRQRKRSFKLARECLLTYFTHFKNLELNSELLDKVMDVFIWPAVDELRESAVPSVNWILRLFNIWSLVKRYRDIFGKKRIENGVTYRLYSILYELLPKKTTGDEVKLHLLTIIFNLISDETDDEDKPLTGDSATADNLFEIGCQVLRNGKTYIVEALQDGQLFKQLCLTSKNNNLCYSLLPRLTEFLDDPELLRSLVRIVVECIAKFKVDGEKLLSCFDTLRLAIHRLNAADQIPLLSQMAPLFTLVKDDGLRRVLFNILNEWKDDEYRSIILGINSWTAGVMDTPDMDKRIESFGLSEKSLEPSHNLNYLFCNLLLRSCFHCLEKNTQLAEVVACSRILKKLAQRLLVEMKKEDIVACREAHQFITSTVIPLLLLGVNIKEGGFNNALDTLGVFINELHEEHGTFAELKFLVDDNILTMLTDLQIPNRKVGMNNLARVLQSMKDRSPTSRTSPATLLKFVKPLAYRSLLKETQASSGINMNDLVDSSIEVIKAMLCLLPYQSYLKFLNETLQKTTTSPKVMKQLERLLTGAMESFHFDLSAAVEDPSDEIDDIEMEDIENNDNIETNTPPSQDRSCVQTLSHAAAKKCLSELINNVIPELNKCLKAAPKLGHKLSDVKTTMTDEGVVGKVAFAKALGRLIVQLPKGSVANVWDTLIPNLCGNIKSKEESVRNVARGALVEVLKDVGMEQFPKAFHYLLSLRRGYQKHVLHFTVWFILTKCEEELKKCPKVLPIKGILELCLDELFGTMREEKKVEAITSKTREAKKDNARPLLIMCAKFAQDTSILAEMISIPLQRVTLTSANRKVAAAWLACISTGLARNEYIAPEEITLWLGGQLEQYSEDTSLENTKLKKETLGTQKSTLDIEKLGNGKVRDSKSQKRLLLAEFVFQSLYEVLKTTQISMELSKAFIPHLVEGLHGNSKLMNLAAMRCVTCLFSYGVFDFARDEEVLNSIWRQAFLAMGTYSLSDIENSDTINAIFKCLTTFLGTFQQFKIMQTDFDLLTRSMRAFLTQGHCASNAISLLKGVIRKNITSEGFTDLMKYVQTLSISSQYTHILEGCRGLYLDYILQYSVRTSGWLDEVIFYLRHLSYEQTAGRHSALQMLNLLIAKLPRTIVQEITGRCFGTLVVALDHEEDVTIRAGIRTCVKLLLGDEKSVQVISVALVKMMANKDLSSKHVFAQVGGWLICGGWRYVTETHINSIMKFYEDILGNLESMTDQAVVQTLFALKDIFEFVFSLPNKKWDREGVLEKSTRNILDFLRISCLSHAHLWSQVIAMELCAIIFTNLDSRRLLKNFTVGISNYCSLLMSFDDLRGLIESHIGVFKTKNLAESQVIEAATKNLKTFMRFAISFYSVENGKFVLDSFMKQIVNLINHEVTKNPGETNQRRVSYKLFKILVWTVEEGDEEECDILLHFKERIMRSALRDVTDANTPSELKGTVEALLEKIKSRVGEESYLETYLQIQKDLTDRRMHNRAKKSESAVLHPGVKRKRTKSASGGPKHTKSKKPRRSQK